MYFWKRARVRSKLLANTLSQLLTVFISSLQSELHSQSSARLEQQQPPLDFGALLLIVNLEMMKNEWKINDLKNIHLF